MVSNSARGQAGTWQAVTSTPSFELWLLLHFHYSTAPIVRVGANSPGEMAVRALRVHLPDYAKGTKGIFNKVADSTDVAVKNAAALAAYNAGVGSNNPATDVHILVDYLRKLKRA
jgi:RloB-like protein